MRSPHLGQDAADLRKHFLSQHEDSIVQQRIIVHVVRLIDAGNLERIEVRTSESPVS